MQMTTGETLQDITGYESGLIMWDDGEQWVLNWVPYRGLPRELGPIAVGLGEALTARPCRVPAGAVAAMREHEASAEGGGVAASERSRRSDLKAWRVNDTATVVVSANWA